MKVILEVPSEMRNTRLSSIVAFKCKDCNKIHVLNDGNEELFASTMCSLISTSTPYVICTRDTGQETTKKVVQNMIDVLQHFIQLNQEYLQEKGK